MQMEVAGHAITLSDAAGVVKAKWSSVRDAIDAIQSGGASALLAQRVERWVGFLAYELAMEFEAIKLLRSAAIGHPALFLVACGGDGEVVHRDVRAAPTVVVKATARAVFERSVERGLEYIQAGDVFQVNLSHQMQATTTDGPGAVFARLQASPARFGAMIDAGNWGVVSHSPELFMHVTSHGLVTTRPIKGTRPASVEQEGRLIGELTESEKDKAELAMIVDLMRNDLGRVAAVGSVKVIEARAIERHPTVLQAVATIQARLRPGVTAADVLAAMFPCGSVTGAPKVRAMQIIDELEATGRGVYCGTIGWMADGAASRAAGDSHLPMQWSVAIRTMTFQRQGDSWRVIVPVGAGIVADSVPADEWEETLVKARAMLCGLGCTQEA